MLARRPRSRRAYAVLALATFLLGGAVEPVFGWMQDGAVHHESRSAAAAHSSSAVVGEHGHEDGATTQANHPHEPGHEHGTGQDHCTHAHGLFVGLHFALSWVLASELVSEPPILLAASSVPTHAPPPPRA